jgi:hypothetical protein
LAQVEPRFHQGYGYINKTGKWVIQPQFDEAMEFRQGLAAVRMGADERGFGGYWGFIDRQERWIIRPTDDDAYSFSEGFARICLGEKGRGFIHK